ncbi:MAG: LamG domain-containing protein [Photobacterium aquimaris]|nr:LamG domain-containing protein [Photobacterium aquimaris]
MSTLTFYLGRQGDRGIDGENGFTPSDIDGSLIDNPVLDLFKSNKLSEVGAATWARSGDGSIKDRYGNYSFISGGDITNFYDYSNDFTQWSDPLNKWSIDSTGNADPLGGSNATNLILDGTTTTGQPIVDQSVTGLNQNIFNTMSFWFRLVSGSITSVEVTIGTETVQVPITMSGTYQRVSVTIGVTAASAVTSINPIGISGAVFSIFGAQFENSSALHDYIETTGAPVTVPNPFPVARSNELGYLFEDQKTNLIEFSENLSEANWTIESGSLSSYPLPDIFGDSFKNINVSFTNNPTVTIRSTGAFTEGETYTISVFVKLLSGTLDSITAALTGGSQVSMGDLLETEYTRLTATVVAGASGTMDISFISSNQSADLLIVGAQAELGGLSSYIRTTGNPNTRPEDDCNLPYNLMGAGEPWTVSFSHFGIINDTKEKYIFNNGLTASDEFSMRIVSDTLIVNIGGLETTFLTVLASTFIAVTYDSTNLKLYINGVLTDTQANTGTSGAVPTTFYIGSDETSANSINAFMGNFKFYDSELSANNIRYLTGDIA